MADGVLKSFLVAIGYREDEASKKKFIDGVAKAEKAVASLSLALAAAATAATAAAIKMAASFEDLFYASQRTGASITNLRGLAYAVSQLGGSYGGAVQSLEAFAKNIRTNPGYESMARKLGVATRENGKLRDTVDILTDLGKVFKKQDYYVAYQYATALGLDENTFRLLRDQPEALKRYRDEYEKTTRRVGLDSEEAARKSTELMQALRSLQMSAQVVAEKLLTDFAPALTAIIEKLRAWIEQNPDQIREWIEGAGKAAVALAAGFMKVVDAVGPLVTGLGTITSSITGKDGLQGGLEAFAIWLTTVWLVRILAAFTGVSTGWAAMLLRFGLNPAVLLAGAAALSGIATAEQLPKAVARGGVDPATGGALDENPLGAFARTPGPRTGKGALEPYRRGWLGRMKDRLVGPRPSIRKGYQPGGTGAEGGGSKAEIRGSTFASKAPGVMRRLMEDFGLTKEEAGVVLGNLGHESAGFTAFEEGGNGPGRGWAQWTDPGRKRRFFQYAQDRGLDPKSDEANYGFLKWELENTHKSSISGLKKAQGFDEKMRIFEGRFEGAGVKAYGSRNRYAARAIAAFDAEEARAAAETRKRPAVDPDRMRSDFGEKPTAPKYDFSRSPAGSENTAPLGTGPVDSSTRNFTQTNKTEIIVQGGTDPQSTANAVAGAQSRVHEMSLRNAQGAVR